MAIETIFFIYGMCVMFYFMAAWMFWRRDSGRLSRLVVMLMLTIGLESVKDLFFVNGQFINDTLLWQAVTAVDMVAVPMYAFLLIELCRPGFLCRRIMLSHLAPFVILPVLFLISGYEVFYYADVAWTTVYGVLYALWTLKEIPRYNRKLKERYSYVEHVNLNWLRVILLSFFVILILWILDCVFMSFIIESAYMVVSLALWMFFAYFLYRHEQAMSELADSPLAALTDGGGDDVSRQPAGCTAPVANDLHVRIQRLFSEERIYLNPRLKLSDISRMVGSNRTYVSDFFNRVNGKTFYEYVNRHRVAYACELLTGTSKCVDVVAEEAGFSSRSTFFRVFSAVVGVTPSEFRRSGGSVPPPNLSDW